MFITPESSVASVVGMNHSAMALDKTILKLGPSSERGFELGTQNRSGVINLYRRKLKEVISKPFCGFRPYMCGNCHEFSGCKNGSPSICKHSPGNPVCGHPEMSHFWIDLERLTVLHGLVTENFSDMSVADITTLRALIRTSEMQDRKRLHPNLVKKPPMWDWIADRGNDPEMVKGAIKKQQSTILEETEGLINRVGFRTEELLGRTSIPSSRMRHIRKKILPDLYQQVSGRFSDTYNTLFADAKKF